MSANNFLRCRRNRLAGGNASLRYRMRWNRNGNSGAQTSLAGNVRRPGLLDDSSAEDVVQLGGIDGGFVEQPFEGHSLQIHSYVLRINRTASRKGNSKERKNNK